MAAYSEQQARGPPPQRANANKSQAPPQRSRAQQEFEDFCGAEELDMLDEYEADPSQYDAGERQAQQASSNKSRRGGKKRGGGGGGGGDNAGMTAEEIAFMEEAIAGL